MEYQDIWQQFTTLPPDAQALVADFIASLKQRHNKSQSPRQPEQKDWRSDPSLVFGKTKKICKIVPNGFAQLVPQNSVKVAQHILVDADVLIYARRAVEVDVTTERFGHLRKGRNFPLQLPF